MSEFWMCKEIKEDKCIIRNSAETMWLKIYKESTGQHIIQAYSSKEDVLEMEIECCPMCGRKLGGKE